MHSKRTILVSRRLQENANKEKLRFDVVMAREVSGAERKAGCIPDVIEPGAFLNCGHFQRCISVPSLPYLFPFLPFDVDPQTVVFVCNKWTQNLWDSLSCCSPS